MRLGLILEFAVFCVTVILGKSPSFHKPVVSIENQEPGQQNPRQVHTKLLLPDNDGATRYHSERDIIGEEIISPRIRNTACKRKTKGSTSNSDFGRGLIQPPRRTSSWSDLPESEAAVLENAELTSKQYGLLSKNGLRTAQIVRLAKAGYNGKEMVSLSNLGVNFENMLKLSDTPGISTQDAIVLHGQGLSVDEIASVSQSGIDVRDFIPLVKKGYRATQLLTLVNSGWTSSQIHSLLKIDVSPFYVLKYVEQKMSADEILSLLT